MPCAEVLTHRRRRLRAEELLSANGFTGLNVKNKNYFGSTRSKVTAFQKAKGLVNSKAGPQTITALGGVYMAE